MTSARLARRGVQLPLLAAVFCAFALLTAGPAASSDFDYGKPAFCEPRESIVDFGFSKLPPISEMPTDGGLPFAPPSVGVFGSWSGEVMSRRGLMGYGFVEENFSGTTLLDWTVTAQLWLLGGKGNALREVDRRSLVIGRLDAAEQPHLNLKTLDRRGFYRLDIQFANRTGSQLGAYSAYGKVVRPFWRARLGLDRRSYGSGQLVVNRLENLGTEWISFGEEFRVQRFRGGNWVPDRRLTPDMWAAWAGSMGPGAVRCGAMRLPRGVAAGRYRILKDVSEPVSARGFRDHRLTASFTVK